VAADQNAKDGELVAAYLTGDEEAWNMLCRRYTKELIGFFFRKVGNIEDAKDLTQDTLMEAMVKLPMLRSPESFRGWLYKIARGKQAKFFRENKRRGTRFPIDKVSVDGITETGVAYAAQTPSPENSVIAKERLDIVYGVISRLPESQRKVLLLKEEGMPQKAIAQELGISIAAAKVRLHRAMKKLKLELETKYPGEFTDLFN